jgi:hypothetical protein
LAKAKDLNDVAIARDNLRDIANGISENKLIKVSGHDSTAARQSMGLLDQKMDQLSPGWTKQMSVADSNWAASKRLDTVLAEADKGQKGRLGSFDTNQTRIKGYTDEEIAAIKKAHQGGLVGTAMNSIGAMNPFHGGLAGAVGMAGQIPHAISTGGTSLLATVPIGMTADLIGKALRQSALKKATDLIASRSPLGEAAPSGIIQMPRINSRFGESLLGYLNSPRDPYQ